MAPMHDIAVLANMASILCSITRALMDNLIAMLIHWWFIIQRIATRFFHVIIELHWTEADYLVVTFIHYKVVNYLVGIVLHVRLM